MAWCAHKTAILRYTSTYMVNHRELSTVIMALPTICSTRGTILTSLEEAFYLFLLFLMFQDKVSHLALWKVILSHADIFHCTSSIQLWSITEMFINAATQNAHNILFYVHTQNAYNKEFYSNTQYSHNLLYIRDLYISVPDKENFISLFLWHEYHFAVSRVKFR